MGTNTKNTGSATSTSFIKAMGLAAVVAVITFFVAAPISGMVLDGYGLSMHMQRPLTLAAGAAALVLLWQLGAGRLFSGLLAKSAAGQNVQVDEVTPSSRPLKNAMIYLSFAVGLSVLPFLTSEYWLTVFILCFIYILLGLGLNIVVGLAGLLDLGFVGFYAVGAYTYALGNQYFGLGFWGALIIAGILAAMMGALLGFPVLRMHGDYLAIVTLGFGEIIRLILNNWTEVTGGPNGVSAPMPTLFGLEFSRIAKQGGTPFHEFFNLEYDRGVRYLFLYFLMLVVTGIMIVFVNRLRNMPMGRAWEALREDEIACRALGINHVAVKLSAFSLGAMVAGMAGVFFAALQGFVNPTSFSFFESALILAIVVLGGMGSTLGVVLAAIAITLLPEVLRDFASYRILIFGVLMVVIMIVRPRGLIRQTRKSYRLLPEGQPAHE